MINFGRIGAVSGDSGEVFRQATVREKLVQEGLSQQSAGSMASESPDEAERPRTREEASRPSGYAAMSSTSRSQPQRVWI